MFGGIKANVGHLEPGAGVAGLSQLCTQIKSSNMYANGHLRRLNPIIRDVGSMMPSAVLAFPTHLTHAKLGAAGASSFGYRT